jgi:hypothetical protein
MTNLRNKSWRVAGVAMLVAMGFILSTVPADAKMTLVDKVGEKELKLQIYGFSQFEIRGGDGASAEGGVFFKAQRIRVGFNYFHGPIAGKLFLDFNQSHTSDEAGLPKMIKDAFVAYRFNNAAMLRLGMIKTPLGMTFTIPGWNLDIIERQGMEKGLVLERNFGLMLSGRLIGQENYDGKKQMKTNGLEMGQERLGYGFGYDIGVFNPSGRSSAVTWDKSLLGDALSYVGRLHYDHGPKLHTEIAYGISEQAGGPDTEDYEVMNLGLGSMWYDEGLEFRLEYTNGSNIRGVEGWDQEAYSLMAGYYFTDTLEGVVKHYHASSDRNAVSTDLDNTYIGFNYFLAPVSSKFRDHQRHKLVFNYILAGGDTEDWAGIGGYRDDAWGLQWQYKF